MLRRLATGAALGVALVLVLAGATASRADDDVKLRVLKRKHMLQVLIDGKEVRRFRVSLGFDPRGPKLLRGDGRTPVGDYVIYDKRPSDRFRWFLALNYPAVTDADRAFKAGLISEDTWTEIFFAEREHHAPPWDTPLGAFIGIHGTGGGGWVARKRQISDWTDGCIAVSDRDIDELYDLTPVGTRVEIRE